MNYFNTFGRFYLLAILLLGCSFFKSDNIKYFKNYPKLKSDQASDIYFGQTIVDKYRSLENLKDPSVQQWITDERILFDSVSKNIPQRDVIKNKLKDVMYSSNVRGGYPRVTGNKVFFFRSFVKEKCQSLLYKADLAAKEVELFNTQSLNRDNKIYSIDYYEASYDGKYLAFGLSLNGDEMSVIRIIDVDRNTLLTDSIERATYGTPFWLPDNKGFFYAQLKELRTDLDFKTKYEDGTVKLHLLGEDSRNDKVVFSRNLNPDLKLEKIDIPFICTFPNSDKVLAFTFRGSTSYLSLYYTSLSSLIGKSANPTIWEQVCDGKDKVTAFALNSEQLFLLGFKDNPNGVLKKYTLSKKVQDVTTIVEGKSEILEDIIQTPSYIYLKELKNGNSVILSINLITNTIHNIVLPFTGYAYIRPPNFGTPPVYLNTDNLFFAMESWNREFGVYNYDPKLKQSTKTDLRVQGKYGNPEDILVKEVEVLSHDGALVPLTIVYSKGVELNSKNPTLIEGYGAYGVSMNATFDFPLQVWLKMGGIYAVAHVRGGGEKGDDWYKGGFKTTKANSWKDFIACSEYLIKNKYTSPHFLAAKGASAGGITAGRAITERPDLFKAAIIDVGKLNSLRSENTSNSLSITEYGTVKDSIEFVHILDMDVYHHIKNNVTYPSLLISAGLKDARVDWWQPAKAAARFQEVSEGKDNIVLFKLSDEGHFGVSDKINAATDEYSFLLWQLRK